MANPLNREVGKDMAQPTTSVVSRAWLAVAGAALVAAATIGLGWLGVSYVNIDNLDTHRLLFIALFVCAPAFGLLSLILAVLPRLIQINLLVFLCLWLLVELAFGVVNRMSPALTGDPEAANGKYHLEDPILGYRLPPNTLARHTERFGAKQIYSVTYATDELGRRRTPIDTNESRPNFLLFFGCSNTFGDGMEQNETLPYWAGTLAHEYMPYNFGLSGWGPAQMLDLVTTRDLAAEVPQRDGEGYAFFFFIEDHINRVIGSSQVSTVWGKHFSHYVLDASGHAVREGNFATGRPFTTLFYDLVASSSVLAYFGITLPRQYSPEDYRLTAQVIRQSRDALEKQFKLRGFYVVIAPAFDDRQRRIYRTVMNALQNSGVKFLDFSQLYDTDDLRYRVAEHDYHNSALANRRIAEAIVTQAGVTRAPAGRP